MDLAQHVVRDIAVAECWWTLCFSLPRRCSVVGAAVVYLKFANLRGPIAVQQG